MSHGSPRVTLTRLASALTTLGAVVRRGDLDDLDGLHEAASDADGGIHLAFKHVGVRAGDLPSAAAADLAAVQALADALRGTDKGSCWGPKRCSLISASSRKLSRSTIQRPARALNS